MPLHHMPVGLKSRLLFYYSTSQSQSVSLPKKILAGSFNKNENNVLDLEFFRIKIISYEVFKTLQLVDVVIDVWKTVPKPPNHDYTMKEWNIRLSHYLAIKNYAC